MIDVMSVIASIETEKKQRGIFPSYALMEEITNKVSMIVRDEINHGVVDGKLKWYQTINSLGFETLNNLEDGKDGNKN